MGGWSGRRQVGQGLRGRGTFTLSLDGSAKVYGEWQS